MAMAVTCPLCTSRVHVVRTQDRWPSKRRSYRSSGARGSLSPVVHAWRDRSTGRDYGSRGGCAGVLSIMLLACSSGEGSFGTAVALTAIHEARGDGIHVDSSSSAATTDTQADSTTNSGLDETSAHTSSTESGVASTSTSTSTMTSTSTSASTGSDTGTTGPACPAQQIECDGACVDPSTDPDYCGADADCRGGQQCERDTQICRDGRCVAACEGRVVVKYRDFMSSHPDMEIGVGQFDPGIVADRLGGDGLPVYAGPAQGTATVSGRASFDQWYRDVPGVNVGLTSELMLEKQADGMWVIASSAFFPLDGLGFGNEGHSHNFHFTMELHSSFVYHGGEVFEFRGDDDVFAFINGHRVIDLGGIHTSLSARVELDRVAADIGLVVGGAYPLDFFFAERHTSESNFELRTSFACVDGQR